MKKLLIIIILFLPEVISAQRFNGGILLGLTASQVDGDSYSGFDRVGLQGGVFVNTFLSGKSAVQMEIKYTSRGARKKTAETDTEIYKLNLHYIDMPVLFLFEAQKKIILEAGIITGYLFASSGEESGGKLDSDYMADFKKFDLDWMLGLRYRINEKLSAGIRYSYSLFSINNYENISSNYSVIGNLLGYSKGDYNNYLSFGIYYRFNR
ncbi:MAG: PorT family protein [Bacteroidales bacterium]|nr:PorT family protein [Bacteroidales bacterium]